MGQKAEIMKVTEFNIEIARFNMVEQQIRPWEVFDKQVLDLMGSSPRHEYVPRAYKNLAFADMHIPLSKEREIMPPKVEARLLQALEVQSSDKILEIGTGCGYLSSLLAALGAHVYSVDTDPAFTALAADNLSRHGIDNVTLETGNALDGWGQHGPYDVIVLNGSVPVLPEALLKNLSIGGRMVAVIGKSPVMEAKLFQRVGDRSISDVVLFETDLAPLPGAEAPRRFEF
jgi:protein-L-isoaspartate(D-aspartate) O-methyltransferase